MKHNKEQKADSGSVQQGIAASPLLGEVAFSGSRNHYTVNIEWEGENYEWHVDRVRCKEFHYTDTPGMWCYQISTLGIKVKTSVKRKMKRLVEAAVANLA